MQIVYFIVRVKKDCHCGDPDCEGTSIEFEGKKKGQWTESILSAKEYPSRSDANAAIERHCDMEKSEGNTEVWFHIDSFSKP